MRLSIRTRLLALCLFLVILTTASISIIYYVVTRQNTRRESQQRIQVAFDIVLDDADNRQQQYIQQIEQFLQGERSLHLRGLTSFYSQGDDFLSAQSFLTSLHRVSAEIKELGQTLSAQEIAVYGMDARLLAAYRQFPQETVGGYVTTRTGVKTYLPMDDLFELTPILLGERPIPEMPLPSGIPATLPGKIPDAIVTEWFHQQQQLGIRIIAPVWYREQKTGILVGEMVFTQQAVEHYAALSKTAINMFAGRQFSVGTLPAQQEFLLKEAETQRSCDAFRLTDVDVVIESRTFAAQEYYQGVCTVGDASGRILGVMTVSLSQEEEQQAIRKLVTTVGVAAMLVSIMAFGLTVALSRGALQFIQQQIEYIERLAQGDIPKKLTKQYQGEFESMKTHLNRLIDASEETTRLAEEVAQGNLGIDVWERSEQDRLMQALNAMIRRLNRFSHELDGLVQAVSAGDLSRRGNVTLFSGGWQNLVGGVNKVIDAFVEMTMLNENLKTENLRMGAELEISRRIQQMVLPPPEELRAIEGLDIAGIMQPADEVGGDYYDVLACNGTVHLGIGDVTGHGLESGILMLMTQTAIRTLIEHGEPDPEIFLATINRMLYKNLQRMQVDKTLTLACVNYQQGVLKLVGQHEELLVARRDGRIERVDTVNLGFPLGLTDDIAAWLASATVTLEPGDGIVLYTDGIPEAENPDGEMYGIERLCNVISRHWAASADAVQQAVMADATAFIGTRKVLDDLTLVVVKQR